MDSHLDPPTYATNRAKSPTVNDPERIISAAAISMAPVATMSVEPFIDDTAASRALSLIAALRRPSLSVSKWPTARRAGNLHCLHSTEKLPQQACNSARRLAPGPPIVLDSLTNHPGPRHGQDRWKKRDHRQQRAYQSHDYQGRHDRG